VATPRIERVMDRHNVIVVEIPELHYCTGNIFDPLCGDMY
jgi:hypothetical protein